MRSRFWSKLAALPDDYLLLVQFVRVKQGPGGSWNPYSGAITSGMSTTSFQAALISTRTGQVAWKNEVLERTVVPPSKQPTVHQMR